MRAHGLHREVQALADLGGAEPFDQQPQHLEFAVGEHGVVQRLVAALDEARRGGLADVHAAGRDLAQRAEQRLGGAVLVEVALRAGLQRARGVLLLPVHGEHQDPQLRLLELEALDEVDAREPRHRHVEHGDVVVVGADERERLVAARGSPATCRSVVAARMRFSPSRTILWSSATSTRIMPLSQAGEAAQRTRSRRRVPPRGARAISSEPPRKAMRSRMPFRPRARLGEVLGCDAAAVVLDLDLESLPSRRRASPRRSSRRRGARCW